MKNFQFLTKTEKAIRLSWACNNASQLMSGHVYTDAKMKAEVLDDYVNFFLNYFDSKMEELEKQSEKEIKEERAKQTARNAKSADRRELKDKNQFEVRDVVDFG